jgi:putative peptidoglycan lipid II flippase
VLERKLSHVTSKLAINLGEAITHKVHLGLGGCVLFKNKHIGLTTLWALQAGVSFLAQAVIAAYFGTSLSLDAYLVGTALPTLVYMIVSSAFVASITMYFNQVKMREGEAAAAECISGLIMIAGGIGLLLTIAIFIGADAVVRIIAPGFTTSALEEAIGCLRITSLSLPFLIMYSLLIGLLNAQHIFVMTTIASILLVGLIPAPIMLGATVTSQSLAWGFNSGAVSACSLLLSVAGYNGSLCRIRMRLSDWKEALSVSIAPMSTAAAVHLLWLSERYFASSLDPGTISALNYGLRIVNFVAGGLSFATSTVLLPYLSAWMAAGERQKAAGFNRKTIIGISICAIAGIVLVTMGSNWLVRLAYGRGKFGDASITLTTTAVWLYLGVFVSYLYGVVMTPNALAMNERRLVIIASIALLSCYLVVAPFLKAIFGYEGLPLAASLAFMTNLSVLVWGMWKSHPDLYWKPRHHKITSPVTSA